MKSDWRVERRAQLAHAPFLQACRKEKSSHTPVWLMRQAGRYQAKYREIRAKYSMLELCQHPEEVTRVTLLPIEQFGMDAAILFSDITIPYLGMNIDFDIVPGVGPVIESPLKDEADVGRLEKFCSKEQLSFVGEAIQLLTRELKVPLIGFAGAPFTMAAYLIEGKPSKDFKNVRKFLFQQPDAWHTLMSYLTDITIDYLKMQVDAGVDALQVFDSWVGALHPRTYEEYLLPHMSRLFTALGSTGVPLIHFGTGTASLLSLMRRAGGDVIGIDWRTPLRESWDALGRECAVQGNFDPAVLFADTTRIQQEADRVLKEIGGEPGHIFNLGHGVLPGTPEDHVRFLVEYVQETTAGA
ncbi:uroporphyrinogen decarboxylase [bacterium]|nr:uroporphyrinogen decarboxylase [bacterium]